MKYSFTDITLPKALVWMNEPARWQSGLPGLELITDANTDLWQRTHYGFRRDTAHALLRNVGGDFCLTTTVTFQPVAQYDQCGLLVRIDPENWIKVSCEFEDSALSRLGSVATNLGYSDWATQDVPSTSEARQYRITRLGTDFLIESAGEDAIWRQMRIVHLHKSAEFVQAGIYACSPAGEGCSCQFRELNLDQ